MKTEDWKFYRNMVSHRAAVRVLVELNKLLSSEDHPYFYGYYRGEKGEYDRAAYNMLDTVRELKQEVAEYRKLKAALQPLLKN